MRAELADPDAITVEPPHPRLGEPSITRRRAVAPRAGSRSRAGWRSTGGTGLFDDLVGAGWQLIGWEVDPAAQLDRRRPVLVHQHRRHRRATSVADGPVHDVDGTYRQWFDAHECIVAAGPTGLLRLRHRRPGRRAPDADRASAACSVPSTRHRSARGRHDIMTMRITRLADAEPFSPSGTRASVRCACRAATSTPTTDVHRRAVALPARRASAELAPQPAETVYVVLSGALVMISEGEEATLEPHRLRALHARHDAYRREPDQPPGQHARDPADRPNPTEGRPVSMSASPRT